MKNEDNLRIITINNMKNEDNLRIITINNMKNEDNLRIITINNMKNEDNYVLCSECETNPCECKSWEKEFEKEFVSISEIIENKGFVGTKNQIKAFIEKVIKEEKEKLKTDIGKIDFYGWNEETQVMIKKKIEDLR